MAVLSRKADGREPMRSYHQRVCTSVEQQLNNVVEPVLSSEHHRTRLIVVCRVDLGTIEVSGLVSCTLVSQ